MVKRLKDPSELEKTQHEALAVLIDHFQFPFEVTNGGLTLIRLSQDQVDQIKQAFALFSMIYGLELNRGKYVEIPYAPSESDLENHRKMIEMMASSTGLSPEVLSGDKP